MANLFGNIVNFVFVLIGIVIIAGIIVRLCFNYLSREKEVSATVVNKQCYEKQVYKKSQAPLAKKEYIITFLCKSKKLNFEVSKFSYNGYKINQKGILKYKGSMIIDFKRSE